ncbi:hypothetical protein COO60DRAFT_187722 [Scenedesmus sp. NREL 46B-D3]|nr:hypothetical protein COO60DRAFT_187722 [Scenedesmus sp. NREL 46B-D3]
MHLVLLSAGRFSAYSLIALGMHGHLVMMWQHVFGDVWVVILMPRRHYINKPFKAFIAGAVAHQGGGWVQLLQGSEEALCLLSPSVSPWSASSWGCCPPGQQPVSRFTRPPTHPPGCCWGFWF